MTRPGRPHGLPPTRTARRPDGGYTPGGARRVAVRFGADELAGLDTLAARWACSRSEAVRRAVAYAVEETRT